MRVRRIITADEKIYNALNALRHQEEIIVEKPIDYRSLDRILTNNDNIIAVSNGRHITLKRLNNVKTTIYLKRIW